MHTQWQTAARGNTQQHPTNNTQQGQNTHETGDT
jgi:hypothetical protein